MATFEPLGRHKGINWAWFHEEVKKRKARLQAGMCANCGERPQAPGRMTCAEASGIRRDGDEGRWEYYQGACAFPPDPVAFDRCSFCGRKYSPAGVNCGSVSSAKFPCPVRHCAACSMRRIPEGEAAFVGQTIMQI